MTPGPERIDERKSETDEQFSGTSRRRVLSAVGGGAVALLGGCLDGSDATSYVDGDIDAPENVSSDNASRSATEMSTAASLAEVEPNRSASPLSSLELENHEYAFEGGYEGSTVQGTVSNTGDEPIKYTEVRVRVFDDDGSYLGLYLDSVSEFSARTSWNFEVIVLNSLDTLADYEIGVFGIPK